MDRKKSAVPTATILLMCISAKTTMTYWLTEFGNNSLPKKPEVLTREEKRAWLDTMKGVSLGSDAFFPFGDNIERAHKSGVEYIAQAGDSVRDDHVIDTCDKYGITMAFTGVRLFHH